MRKGRVGRAADRMNDFTRFLISDKRKCLQSGEVEVMGEKEGKEKGEDKV